MGIINIHSTEDLPPCKRVRYWNEWSSATITRSNIEPIRRDDFYGKVTVLETGSVRFANFVSDPANLSHTRYHVAADNDHAMILHFQLGGYSLNDQDGRQTVINTGDYTLCDSSRPYRLSFDTLNDMLSIRIPHDVLGQRICCPETLTCVHMSGETGVNRVVADYIRSSWKLLAQGVDSVIEKRLVNTLLDLLATSYAAGQHRSVHESSVMTTRRLLIRQFIEDNLNDPELSPSTIALAFGYTPAYLHRLFRAEDESIHRYIIRRRLEKSAELLADPSHGGRRVNDIAYDLGFKSATHFGRAFKQRYELTPKEFRQQVKTGMFP